MTPQDQLEDYSAAARCRVAEKNVAKYSPNQVATQTKVVTAREGPNACWNGVVPICTASCLCCVAFCRNALDNSQGTLLDTVEGPPKIGQNEQNFKPPQNSSLGKNRKSGTAAPLGMIWNALVFCAGPVAPHILKMNSFSCGQGPNRPWPFYSRKAGRIPL